MSTVGVLRYFCILVVFLVALIPQPVWAESFQVGGSEVSIAAPAGYILLDKNNPDLKALYDYFDTARNKELNEGIAYFVDLEDLKQALQGDSGRYVSHINVSGVKKSLALVYTQQMFDLDKLRFKMLFLPADRQAELQKKTEEYLPGLEKRMEKYNVGDLSLKIGSMAADAPLYEDDHVISFFMPPSELKMQGRTAAFAMTISLLRVKDRFIQVYIYKRYAGPADLDVLRGLTLKWVQQIISQNQEYSALQ